MGKTSKSSTMYSAPALDKGLDILEFLSESGTAQSQAEIAQGLKRSPNEIYRILVVLESRGFLIRDKSSGKYRLSLRLYMLSHTHSPIEQLNQAAQIPMMELAESIGQGCHLSVPYNNKLLVVSQVKSSDPISLSISEGTLFPLLTTTSGRVILANHPAAHQIELLSRDSTYNNLSKKEQTKVLKRLSNIKQAGYQFAESEITVGVTDCAAFVGHSESGLIAAIAVSSLSSRLEGQLSDKTSIIDAVLSTAEKINLRVGIDYNKIEKT